jgi:alpha-tubulin suppressor-like RCC1 family protein
MRRAFTLLLILPASTAGCGGGGSTEPVSVASVEIMAPSATLIVGTSVQLTAVARSAAGASLSGRTIAWAGLDPAAAAVSATGLVTGVAPGSARVVASCEGRADTVSLTVAPVPVASVTVSPAADTLAVAGTVQFAASVRDSAGGALTGRTVTWHSSDTLVADVSASGLVTARAGGRTTITASSEGKSGSAQAVVLVRFVVVAPGGDHTCALDTDGRAYCWGSNSQGQLGNGTTADADHPVPVASTRTFTAIAAAGNGGIRAHTCAIASGGAAWCWGSGLGGELGDGGQTGSPRPVAVAGGHVFVGIAVGWPYSCGVTASGTTYCWGQNTHGAFGDGTTTSSLIPVPGAGGMAFSRFAGGDIGACGLTASGEAYCWGRNSYGQLGTGDTQPRLAPTAVTGGLVFADIGTGGYTACGLEAGGAAYCWGLNAGGQVGDSTQSDRSVPTAVAGGLSFTALTSRGPSCGLAAGGAAFCWGGGTAGVSGTYPVAVGGGVVFTSLAAGGTHACGVAAGPAAYCWGSNSHGQLGGGGAGNSAVPVKVAFQP